MVDEITGEPRIEELSSVGNPSIRAFLKRVPRGEYSFLKDDLEDPTVIDTWRLRSAQLFVAYLDDELAGLVAIIPGLGWSRHVGDLRMVVDPAVRGRGVGAALARRALDAAATAGLEKVSVEVLADQEPVAALFTGLGFTPEALLADQVRDESGQFHDLLILAQPVEQARSALAAIGIVDTGAET